MSTNGHKPPALGNVTIRRVSETEWQVQRDGETVAAGLDLARVTAIVRAPACKPAL